MLRVQTGERSWAVAQTFLEAKPETTWRKILENHMDDESFKDIENPGLKEFRNSHKMAFYHSIENMVYYSKQCELKILWTSPAKTDVSFGFPKKSPLLPFFKYAYKKLRQVGALKRISERWKKTSSKCELNDLKPISFKTIGSLIALLSFGFLAAFITFFLEKIYKINNDRATIKKDGRLVQLEKNEITEVAI